MGFPDDFQFTGTKIEIAKQIGNAVPPPLARAVARHVRKLLDSWSGLRLSVPNIMADIAKRDQVALGV
ncbi:hypothetical protein AGMMS49925_08240 [Deltaproteobacteria bacterium]|nr:hypothetical protein AGMMS49925_08240 [Deltaproteobacteria bacterium]